MRRAASLAASLAGCAAQSLPTGTSTQTVTYVYAIL
eukprot:gene2741-7904_t